MKSVAHLVQCWRPLVNIAGQNDVAAVLALGGVDSPERAAEAIRAGAAGIGVRRGIAVARDPARLVQSLCAAIDEARAELAAKSVGERAVAGKLVLR